MIELIVILGYLVSGILVWRQLYRWRYKNVNHTTDAFDRFMGVLTTFTFPLVLLVLAILESGPVWRVLGKGMNHVLVPKTQYELDQIAKRLHSEAVRRTAQLDHDAILGPEYDIHDDQEVADSCSICKELARKERNEREIQAELDRRAELAKQQRQLATLRSGQANKIIAQLTTMNPQLDQIQLDTIRRSILKGGRSPDWYINRFGKQDQDEEAIYSYESYEPIKTLNRWEY